LNSTYPRETAKSHYLLDNKGWPAADVESLINKIGNERQAEGRIRAVKIGNENHNMAVGALDNPYVKRAVQDIVEGSEEAFNR